MALKAALRHHPDLAFVKFLITGFKEGFHPAISAEPSISFECRNLQSAINDPSYVDRLLSKEIEQGNVICPLFYPIVAAAYEITNSTVNPFSYILIIFQ